MRIIALGHTFGLEVVAEGVADIEQVTVLRELDCHALQCHLSSHPLPAQALAD